MLGKKSLLILLMFIFSGCFGAKFMSEFPDYSKKFPSSKYLAEKGSGKSELNARMAAKAEIANIFESKISSDLYSEVKSSSGSSQDEKFSRSLKSKIRVESSAVISGIEIAQSGFDKRTKQYYAVAVLDKFKVKSIWDKEIENINAEIQGLSEAKKNLKSDLLVLINLKKTAELWVKKEAAAVRLKVIGFSDFETANFDIKKCFTEIAQINSRIRMYVEVSGQKSDTARQKISQRLSEKGFILTENKKEANAYIKGALKVREVRNRRSDNVRFAMAEISLAISDIYGNKVFQIKERKRAAHQDYNEAVHRAVIKCVEAVSDINL